MEVAEVGSVDLMETFHDEIQPEMIHTISRIVDAQDHAFGMKAQVE
jgi:hypothetical protein